MANVYGGGNKKRNRARKEQEKNSNSHKQGTNVNTSRPSSAPENGISVKSSMTEGAGVTVEELQQAAYDDKNAAYLASSQERKWENEGMDL